MGIHDNRILFYIINKHLKLIKIHIDKNWTAVKGVGICIENRIHSTPYIIEDGIELLL